MDIDIHEKSKKLLEILANSIHDRMPNNFDQIFFTVRELDAAERWMVGFVNELRSKWGL